MPLPDNFVRSYFRHLFILQLLAGFVLLAVAYQMGWVHFKLIREGIRTQGTIVAFKEETFGRTGSGHQGSTAFMPIVEYRVSEKSERFRDWMGRHSSGGVGEVVPVLYDGTNHTLAIWILPGRET